MDLETINLAATQFLEQNPWAIYVLIAIAVWKLIWYGLALYKSVELKQKAWFTVLFVGAFILNDLGVLPIIYLLLHRDKKQKPAGKKK